MAHNITATLMQLSIGHLLYSSVRVSSKIEPEFIEDREQFTWENLREIAGKSGAAKAYPIGEANQGFSSQMEPHN